MKNFAKEPMADNEQSLDEALGLSKYLVPLTPEQSFYDYLCSGAAPRVDNMLYELRHNLEHFKYLKESGVYIAKPRNPIDSRERLLTNEDYIKLMVQYYMKMMHLSRFAYNLHDEDGSNLPKLDFDKTIALFMAHDGVKKIIRDDENSG